MFWSVYRNFGMGLHWQEHMKFYVVTVGSFFRMLCMLCHCHFSIFFFFFINIFVINIASCNGSVYITRLLQVDFHWILSIIWSRACNPNITSNSNKKNVMKNMPFFCYEILKYFTRRRKLFGCFCLFCRIIKALNCF